ncbi:hypothetical protein LSTR_LSTR013911 [Laodelphax striatellus]|uniref:Ketoreductase domain-containing protein n=1 Tax=Laodelphax striatellus TaxID=195883 RepID=A0A482X3K2_LAOST|nr:hypothetical protein LSTR_LSTR013911 [Laodelphax striatellus]
MDFLTLIGFFVVLYLFVYLIVLSISDCDLGLLWAERFGEKLDTFKGKVVWITGASSGIGEHLAIVLAKHGAKLILSARSEENLLRVQQRCIAEAQAYQGDIAILPLDVTDFSKHEQCFQKAIHQFGKLDILVNNAGRSQRAVWEDIDVEVDKQLFTLNVFGAVALARKAIRHFNDQGSGHLVVTSSLAGVIPAPFSASYTGSKFALHGYFNCLRNEKLGSNLAITLLCPGPVFSNFLNEAFTNTPGEKFGQKVSATDRRMSAERCATLSAIAIANKLDEVWMALFPVLHFTYIVVNWPYLTSKIMKLIGPQLFQKMRDSKQTVQN